MTWTKLSDNWTEQAVFEPLPFEDRWHYLAMIQLCSRSGRIDGVLRTSDARRCSDVPDPAASISRLVAAGLLEIVKEGVRIVHIDEHVPPPHVRNKSANDKLRQRRHRAHEAGDHSLCLPKYCPNAPAVTPSVTRDIGTETGQHGSLAGLQADPNTGEVNEWTYAPDEPF